MSRSSGNSKTDFIHLFIKISQKGHQVSKKNSNSTKQQFILGHDLTTEWRALFKGRLLYKLSYTSQEEQLKDN